MIAIAPEVRPCAIRDIRVRVDLQRAHWDEVARNKGVMVLDPDWPRYEAMEDADNLLVFGAFVGEELVGYAINIVATHLHYRGLLMVHNDAIFVAQSHRGGRLGLMLLREVEKAAANLRQSLGYEHHMVSWHAKPDTALNEILPRLGYGVQDIIYTKGE